MSLVLGLYSEGNSFPNYIVKQYCSGDDSWRVSYNIYFVHDGVSSWMGGHRHDWESATVIWKRDQEGNDWWHRGSVFLSQHKGGEKSPFSSFQTVDGIDDVREEKTENGKKHPKVWVGFFKHAMFKDEKTDFKTPGADGDEYRSSDWWRLPGISEMRDGLQEIPSSRHYSAKLDGDVATLQMIKVVLRVA
ncbi:MAG: hypothetical protein Q9164_003798 [Protoblastenia rupestris]